VDVRLTATTLEVFLKGERVAVHGRSYVPHTYTTLKEHMPSSHQKHLEWSPSRLIRWAKTIGPATAGLVEKIMADKPHPEQGYRACLGVMRLARSYPNERVEAAARRALAYNACSFRSMKSILIRGLDRVAPPANGPSQIPLFHDNIRGRDYYQTN
jgi:transposase